jgi:hypothetical protein
MRVKMILFPWSTPFDDIEGSKAWLQTVLSRWGNDKRIAYIDLFNEMNTLLGDNPTVAVQPNAICWARAMLDYARTLTSIPLTISTNNPDHGIDTWNANGIRLDLFDLHYYRAVAESALPTFRNNLAAANNQPLFIGETGYTTFNSETGSCDDNGLKYMQDKFIRTVEYGAYRAGLPFVPPWTFNDFTATAIPGRNSLYDQSCYGLRAADGTPKLAYESVRSLLQGAYDVSFNNGFEMEGSAGLPAEWATWPKSGAIANFARDTGVSHTGSASVRIGQSSLSGNATPAFYTEPVVPVHPGRTYNANVWARGSAITGNNDIAIAWFDVNGRWLGDTVSSPVAPGDSDWTLLNARGVAPPGTFYCQLHLQSVNNQGTVYFDDVTFSASPRLRPYSPWPIGVW